MTTDWLHDYLMQHGFLKNADAERCAKEIVKHFERALMMAVNEECSCGGGGPTDPHTCPACMVYHRLTT